MAGRTTHTRRVLLLAVAAGLAIGIGFVVLDLFVDVVLLGEHSLAWSLTAPAEVWMRGAGMVLSIAAAVAYARLLLAKEDVATASQRYRTLAESARDDIFIVDRDWRISYMNTHAAKEFGQTPEALAGKSVRELFRGPEVERVSADLQQAFGGLEAYSEAEFDFGGQAKWLSTRLVPLVGSGDRVESVLGISRDVTGTKREIELGDALTRISDVVHARLSVDEVLEAVSTEATAATGADSSMVLTCDENAWTVRFVRGFPERYLGMRLEPAEAEAAERASRSRAPVCIDDAMNDDRVSPGTMERLGVRSMLAVPLITRRGVVGVLLFTQKERPVCFTPGVVEFAKRVATTVSLALDNARLYEEERSVADALQSAILMLPDRLAGIDFARTYHSASEAARVGGDFYDLFALEHGRVGMTIGDISGHGIDAAVLTSLVKNCIRVEATQEDRPPDEVVASASRLLLESSTPEIFATVFFGVLGLADGLLEYCNAGHTTGCVRRRAGEEVTRLPANSPLVGALPGQSFSLATERIGPSDLLFLYTDGLTEARHDHELFGEERLFETLAKTKGASAGDVVRDVMDEVMSFAGSRLRDDLAILSLTPVGEDRRR